MCNHNLIQDRGFQVCTECGRTFGKHIDNSEWRRIRDEHGKDQRNFSYRFKEIYGSKFNPKEVKEKGKWKRLRGIDKHINNENTKLKNYISILYHIKKDLGLPSEILTDAIIYLRRYYKRLEIKNTTNLLGYCIIRACREREVLMSIDKIIESFDRNGHSISNNTLNSLRLRNKEILKLENFSVEKYITKFLKEIKENKNIKERVKRYSSFQKFEGFFSELYKLIYRIIEEMDLNLGGHNPKNTAGAILYFASEIIRLKYSSRGKGFGILSFPFLEKNIENLYAGTISQIFRDHFSKYIRPKIRGDIGG